MAATPQYGTMTFLLQNGELYNVDCYVSDVAAAYVTFDGGAGAGASSPNEIQLPANAMLSDFAIVTGTQDTTKIQILRNNAPLGEFLRYTQHLTTSAQRSPVRRGFPRGSIFRAIQYA